MTVDERRDDLLGFAREAGPEAVPTLLALLEDPARRLAAIEALGATRSTAAADRLQPFTEDADRAVRKAARAALHRLKSSGIAPAPATPPPAPESPLLAAMMSDFDADWSHRVRLYVRGMLGARRELSVVVDARTGLRLVGWREVTKPLEAHLEEVRAGRDETAPGPRWATIPADYGAHLLREAMKRNTASGQSIPAAFLEVERYLPSEDPYREPLIYRFVRPIEVKLDPALLERSNEIGDEPELAQLGLPPEIGLELRREAERIGRSPMLIAGVSRERQLIALAQRAHRAIFTRSVRQALRYLLEETALHFWLSGRQLAAKRAIAAAVALSESDSAETPFSAMLVGRDVFRAAGLAERSAVSAKSSLLWTP
jgi:hypothetical protein